MKITKNPTTKGIFPELRGTLGAMRYPCFVEVKLDGEACIIMYDESWPDKIVTTNKYGTMRSDWSKLDEIADILEDKKIHKATFLAELYYGKGELGALYKLLSNKDNDLDLNLTIYDVAHIVNDVEMNGTTTPLIDRKEILADIFGISPLLTRPKVVNSKQEVMDVFDEVTTLGMEGVVVKGFDGNLVSGPCAWVKIKKKDRTDYPVIAIDKIKERIAVGVPEVKNSIATGKLLEVGVKCMDKEKFKLSIGDKVTIEHQGVLDSGSLRHPVYIGKAEE